MTRRPPLATLLIAAFVVLAAWPFPAPAQVPAAAYDALSWRLIGPFRAGWSTCAAGSPDDPTTFYFGAAGGGVWKTTDAGVTWKPVFDRQGTASIGALAVAASDPQVLYVGTGQVAPRWDILEGDGVYKSEDGGQSWRRVGLADSRHIGAVVVDPRDPDRVLVAALGHLFGPNEERGVFRSEDGGASWQRVLFVNAETGAVDLASDPRSPDVVYAATWQAHRFPWQAYFVPIRGEGSGIYRSEDGGRSWQHVPGRGLPPGPLGRIGLAVAPGTGGQRVWAVIDADDGGLFRSDDGGASWDAVHPDPDIADWYFARLTAHPQEPDTVFVMGRSLLRSTDGGHTLTIVRGAPGGDDYHFMWIDPADPDRRILATDQGTVVSLNGGKSWSSWYNQPTGQFYHVETDDRFPYWIYSGQQDSGTVAAASRSDYGQLTFRDWHPAGGDERGYVVPGDADANVVFTAGLGGRVSRWDATTGQVANVSPWPVSSYAEAPWEAEYRYTWFWPLVRDPHAAETFYLGAQWVMKTADGGKSWRRVSPDLTGQTTDPKSCPQPAPLERARECGYGVVFTIAPSPLQPGLIWVGSDDGLVHLSRDGGTTWQDVSPPGLPEWSKISHLEASTVEPGTAFAAVDRHRMDDPEPYVYVTRDYGRSWRSIVRGLPAGEYVHVVRQDPQQPALLFAGTNRGVRVSFDGGERWQSLQLDLPPADVPDLTLHGDDLVAATNGRGLWVLDDYAPLREVAAAAGGGPYLFTPTAALRLRGNENRDTPLHAEEPTAPNPPAGAAIDYYLPSVPRDPVRLEITDAQGRVVRTFSSDEPIPELPAERYFTTAWLPRLATLGSSSGHHRFVWDLRTPRPPAVRYEYSIAATPFAGTHLDPRGPMVLPGDYEVTLTVDGQRLTRPLTVGMDPRVQVRRKALEAQAAFIERISAVLNETVQANQELRSAVEGSEDAGQRATLEDLERELSAVSEALAGLATDVEAVDAAPTGAQRAVLERYQSRLDAALAGWQQAQDSAASPAS